MENKLTQLNDRLSSLQMAIHKLYQIPNIQTVYLEQLQRVSEKLKPLNSNSKIPESTLHVAQACKGSNLDYYSLIEVPSDYYTWSLQKRAFQLLAPSPEHLCKSVLLQNTRYSAQEDIQNELDYRYSKYYLVIFQYVNKISEKKLHSFIRNDLGGSVVSKQKFNLRLAPEEQCLKLTGYTNGAVAGIGLAEQNVPIILSSSILDLRPPVFWMGGGHVDWKLLVSGPDYVCKTKCLVGDVTIPLQN